MNDLIEFLRQPASATTSGQRAAALLGGSDTGAFAAISLGDIGPKAKAAVPALIAVTWPIESTVATAGASETQVSRVGDVKTTAP